METRAYNIAELRCGAFVREAKSFDMVRYEDFADASRRFAQPHRHNYYMILLVTGGQGQQIIDFNSYPVQVGRLFFMSPGMIHAWESDERVTGYALFFTADFFAQRYHYDSLLTFPFFGTSSGTPFVLLSPEGQAELVALLDIMLDEYQRQQTGMVRTIRSLLNVLLVKAARYYDQSYNTPGVDTHQNNLLKQFEELVDQHFLEKRLVKDYAKLLHITPNYLNILSRELRGKSAGTTIRERIMLEARRRLVHESKTVTEIAYDLNFKDNAYFCRFFKKHEGCSPERFRKLG